VGSDTDATHDEEKHLDDSDDDVANLPGMIPRSRLKKVIQQRKALEQELQTQKEAKAKLEHELYLYNQAMNKMVNPDHNQNLEAFEPLDHEAHSMYMQQINALKQQTEQFQMHQVLAAQEAEFLNKQNDFKEAYQYLLNVQKEANQPLYDSAYEAEMATIDQMRTMATKLLKQNKNVAETFYGIAKQYGYKNANAKLKVGPNLDAIKQNMSKSKVAEVNVAPLTPTNGASNYVRLSDFEKQYVPGNPDSFRAILNALKNS
jgi:hypothetical protein